MVVKTEQELRQVSCTLLPWQTLLFHLKTCHVICSQKDLEPQTSGIVALWSLWDLTSPGLVFCMTGIQNKTSQSSWAKHCWCRAVSHTPKDCASLGERCDALQECQIKVKYPACQGYQRSKIFTSVHHNQCLIQSMKGREKNCVDFVSDRAEFVL